MFQKSAFLFFSLFFVLTAALPSFSPAAAERERGRFSIYFMEEKVGYEEYTWRQDERGFVLEVEGRMTKPIRMTIEELTIRLDSSFIPNYFKFKGTVSGVEQEVSSTFKEGKVLNSIKMGDQEYQQSAEVKRDTFLLPNPMFSPYMLITKKYRCSLEETLELSGYIIPQVETPFMLGPQEEIPCSLLMEMGATQIELITDEQGRLNELRIPLQKLRIVRD
ncbi:MAG: hypothetical protein GQ544_03915 [Candidatus Aminicenantes bacterium]|nr:hypothetical protein [Candidatus Aminicenantes bacterium]